MLWIVCPFLSRLFFGRIYTLFRLLVPTLSQLTAAIVKGATHMGIVIKSSNLNFVAVNNDARDRAIICAIKGEGLRATGLGNDVPNNPAVNHSNYFLVWVRFVNPR